MLALQCRSSYSPSPSPCLTNPPSSFDNSLLLCNCNALNVYPRLPFLLHPILDLERTSVDQSSLCWDSEKTVACNNSTRSISTDDGGPTPKSAADIKKEIAALETEIIHLERYLLSLYQTAFAEHRLLALPDIPQTPTQCNSAPLSQDSSFQSPQKLEQHEQKYLLKHQIETSPKCSWPNSENQGHAAEVHAISGREKKNPGHKSLADHLGTSCLDSTSNTPDRLSEDILRCISSIYCKLANPLRVHSGSSASPTSSSVSSSSIFSSSNHLDSWSPQCSGDSLVQQQKSKQENGPYAATIEVLDICLDDNSFNYAAAMLQNFRLLVRSLEKVDPTKMTREEKLAFWINIHNALVMHGYLAYGTRNRVKGSSILKASYNVGGQCINAYVIQNSILGIRSHLSATWLQSILSPGSKFKAGSAKHAYALEYPEPLVHFALCSGAYSDPVVRVYNAKNIFQKLRVAKEEFIQGSVYVHKRDKIFLPKILHYYAKDKSLSMPGLLDEVGSCLSDVQHNEKFMKKEKPEKVIHWLPQSSAFRYVIDADLAP